MDAKICDRCGAIWKDTEDCNMSIKTIILYKDTVTNSDRIGNYDLCEKCYEGLFFYLKNANKQAKQG
jgi:ribosomal protein L40E